MTYRDPSSKNERNLGQDDSSSIGSWIAGAVVVGALAFGGYYFYKNSSHTADLNKPSSTSKATSGPSSSSSSTGASSGTSGNDSAAKSPSGDPSVGVKGAEDSTSGPSDKKPNDSSKPQ